MDDDPFTAEQKKSNLQNSKCQFCKEVKKLSDTRKIQLRDVLVGKTKVAGKKVTTKTIITVLEGWGVAASVTVVNQHRKGADSDVCRENVIQAWGADHEE